MNLSDSDFMRIALALARRGLGDTAPNPSVGCVIVRDGIILARARTAPGGRPHAETQALAIAGSAARGATAYVTLEPCAHHGKTPPCAQALIEAGIARVVIAQTDPDPRVNGYGIALLQRAGITVETGLGAAQAAALNAGFTRVIEQARPLITLKLATSLDGQIATRTGASQWITGPAARAAGHALRGNHDAIMVGVGTILADDPELTCRLEGYRATKLIRIIVDSHLRTPLTSRLLVSRRDSPIWMLHRDGTDPARRTAFADLGVRLIELPPSATGISLPHAARALATAGITRLLVEGGSTLAAALLQADLIDRLAWFTAPLVIGGDGIPAIAGFGIDKITQAAHFTLDHLQQLGPDRLAHYSRSA